MSATAPAGAAVHGREDLDVADRVEAEALRDARRDELDERLACALRVPALDDEEVGVGSPAGAVTGGCPSLMRCALVTMRLRAAWRKMRAQAYARDRAARR